MPRTKKPDPEQFDVFIKQPVVEDEQPKLDEIVIHHRKNFGIKGPYLLENLPQYNNYLKQPRHTDLEDDNLLLRAMFGGIQNSLGTPPEIFDGLNALEICLMEAGIFKRKSTYFGDMVIQPKGTRGEPIITRRDPLRYSKGSRIEREGHLEGNSLYEIVLHLLTASQIEPIYNRYRRDWKKIFEIDDPEKKQKRFKRLNPYNPDTLKERMDFIERSYLGAVEEFKKELAKPLVPERIVVRMDAHGNPREVRNPEGFVTPGKTYRRGVKGKSFWNLREYANEIRDYFQDRENHMQRRK